MTDRLLDRRQRPMLKRAFFEAGRAVASQRVSLVAAGCAFYATLALFPTIAALISLYGLMFNPDTVQPQLHYLQRFMPPAAFQLISGRITDLVTQPAQGLGFSFVVSLLVSLWSAASGTKSVIGALNLAYNVEDTRGIIHYQLTSLGMTLLAILGAVLAIGILVFIPIAINFIGISFYTKVLVALSSFGAMIAFVLLALGLLYRFGPVGANRVFWAPGAGLATLLWLLGSWAFGIYVGRYAAYDATYGPLATLIGLMMWFYLTAYIVMLGAEVNAALDVEWKKQQAAKAEPSNCAPE